MTFNHTHREPKEKGESEGGMIERRGRVNGTGGHKERERESRRIEEKPQIEPREWKSLWKPVERVADCDKKYMTLLPLSHWSD